MPFRSDRLLEHVSIALVGKYTKLSDSYASVIKALEHSALAINHKLEVKVPYARTRTRTRARTHTLTNCTGIQGEWRALCGRNVYSRVREFMEGECM